MVGSKILRYSTQKTNEEMAATLCIRYKLLKITAVYSVMLGTETEEAEPVTAVAEKVVMQDTNCVCASDGFVNCCPCVRLEGIVIWQGMHLWYRDKLEYRLQTN